MSSALAHINLTDAQNYFMTGGMAGADFSQGEIPGSQLSFPATLTGHKGRKFPKASCVCETPLPVCLRVGFQFGGRINDRNGKTL
jgi:hypothetical protein